MVLRRKRLLRLHLLDATDSVQGVFMGYHAGHYRLGKPELVGLGGTRELDGGPELWVPRARVLYAQVIG